MILAGRTAIVTGGSRGLGRAIAEAFEREGANVVTCARTGDVTVHADVSRREDCERVLATAVERHGSVEVLVNNAGVYGPMGAVEDVDWDEWRRALEVNLYGSVLMARAVVPTFRRAGYGKIVQLSGGGATQPLPRLTAYAASKAAVVRFAETLAHELRDAHVDVNAIAPGALNTAMLDEVLAAGPDAVGEDFYARAVEQHESGGASLERGAELAVFLASAASDGITGRLLSAIWDDWAALRPEELEGSDAYTLRRVVP